MTLTTPIDNVEVQYDIIFDRANYASDTAAGTALKTVLEASGNNSIFIRNGTYDLGTDTGVTVNADFSRITGESMEDTVIKFTNTAVLDLLAFTSNCTVENLYFDATPSADFDALVYATQVDGSIARNIKVVASSFVSSTTAVVGFDVVDTVFTDNVASPIRFCINVNNLYADNYGDDVCLTCRNINNVYLKDMASGAQNSSITLFSSCNIVNNIYMTFSADVSGTGTKVMFNGCEVVNNVHVIGGSYSWESTNSYARILSSCDCASNIYIDLNDVTGTSAGLLSNSTNALSNVELEDTTFSSDPITSSGGGYFSTGLMTRSEARNNLADDGEILVDTGENGWGFAQAGSNEEYALFSFSNAGVVTLIQNSANVVNTDTDGNLCIYDAGSGIAIKNRLGSAKTIRYQVHYS